MQNVINSSNHVQATFDSILSFITTAENQILKGKLQNKVKSRETAINGHGQKYVLENTKKVIYFCDLTQKML